MDDYNDMDEAILQDLHNRIATLEAENERLIAALHEANMRADKEYEDLTAAKEELSALKASARAYIAAHSSTAVRLQDAVSAEQYTKAAVNLEEMLDV